MIKVIKAYVDRFTRELIEPGAVLDGLSEERQKELLKAGVIEIDEPDQPVADDQKPKSRRKPK